MRLIERLTEILETLPKKGLGKALLGIRSGSGGERSGLRWRFLQGGREVNPNVKQIAVPRRAVVDRQSSLVN